METTAVKKSSNGVHMSNGSAKAFDQAGALKIFDNDGAGVELIPLQEVNQHLSTFLWGAIFFGIFMASVGSLVSLLSTDYSNNPVIYLMGLFLTSYFVFAFVFTSKGFVRWGRLKKKSVGESLWNKESLGERVGALERRIQLFKIHRDLGLYVFNGESTMQFNEFNTKLDLLLPFEPDDPRRKKFNQRLMNEGIITVDKSDPNAWSVTYETDFDPTE